MYTYISTSLTRRDMCAHTFTCVHALRHTHPCTYVHSLEHTYLLYSKHTCTLSYMYLCRLMCTHATLTGSRLSPHSTNCSTSTAQSATQREIYTIVWSCMCTVSIAWACMGTWRAGKLTCSSPPGRLFEKWQSAGEVEATRTHGEWWNTKQTGCALLGSIPVMQYTTYCTKDVIVGNYITVQYLDV